ncbi:MAG: BLUF domain-containing protein [Hyphomonadaceae bacterium]|jgi:hypothetical protein|nr:BLUF domain-containing protein [Hyphomonadaceae bacterium]
MLVRCLYASRAAAGTSAAILDDILVQSRRNNPANGITGMLCVSNNVFIQVLEGGRDEVCDLYHAIVRDTRHEQLRLLAYEEITERRFGGWTMGQVNLAKVNPSQLLKYFKRAELDPFDASGSATLSLLSELVASASLIGRGD